MTSVHDVAVVGSGPSGALAAWKLVESGLDVLMIDVGHDDDRYRDRIPDLPFHEIRRNDPNQREYFLGRDLEGIPRGGVRVGAQLTAPRQFVSRGTEEHLPVSGNGFEPTQSLALGGLGAAWGAASFAYPVADLRRIGIHEPGFARFYNEVSRRIGISAATTDDATALCFAGVDEHMPALDVDEVCGSILRNYETRREAIMRAGLVLGRTPIAALSQDRDGREANPYFDMDFWSESRRSVFRPRYLIEELERRPNFRVAAGHLAIDFGGDGDGAVTVRCRRMGDGDLTPFRARRLVLCAGAINSARLVLNALGRVREPVPILCNPYVYIPCLHLGMLGRRAGDRRHSLSQLVAIYRPPDAPDDLVPAQFYGYRSLLLFKLVKELPLPPWAGLRVARLVVNSLAIAGLHHSDRGHPDRTMQILSREESKLPEVRFDYEPTPDEVRRRDDRERAMMRLFRKLGLLPFARISPGNASSIHYAGTLPVTGQDGAGFCRPDGRLRDVPNVYVGDGSGWRYLPALGLTFTLMANALRIAGHVVRDLRGEQ